MGRAATIGLAFAALIPIRPIRSASAQDADTVASPADAGAAGADAGATNPAPVPSPTPPPPRRRPRPYESVVRASPTGRGSEPGRATSRVGRRDIDERLPRSAPDALRYEPGVYVQQTAHSQASAFIRGRTGQQTVLLFDGIRLNTSLFRQGPNQYFFTIDSRTVESIEVIRGGASTRWGTDALGGVLYARPIEPSLDPRSDGLALRPGAMLRAASADGEIGGRVQLDARLARSLSFLGGTGVRRAGLLRSGGPVVSPTTGAPAAVPRFAADGRTQLGTGFVEWASDARLAYAPDDRHRWLAAIYDFRQFDAPRTDQCPPPEAPLDECLRYDEQFRTLAYAAFDGDLGRAARKSRFVLSYQLQHERRTRDRPSSFAVNGGRDDAHTFGLSGQIETASGSPARWLSVKLRYGADLYHDAVDSTAWTILTSLGHVERLSRGQYLAGSTYTSGGPFAEAEATIGERWTLRTGARVAGVRAAAPADPASASLPVDRTFWALAAHGGVEWNAGRDLSLLASLDRSFRAPNLDDLTSRQQTGPGFQIENPRLEPETSATLEVGARLTRPGLEADLWAYWASLSSAIARELLGVAACPPATPACSQSRTRLRLVNLAGPASILGVELSARAWLPLRLDLRATAAYAWGEGPNPQAPPSDPSLPYASRVPLSRIPPLNGTIELRWRSARGPYAVTALRWALPQERLAPTDWADARIPFGGTPGFVVLDLRAGWRFNRRLLVGVVLENVTDAAYRYHGSSVNGPGRGVVVNVEADL